jgi:hypothetical protein
MADYSRLRVFGCDGYSLISKENRFKLEPTLKKCRFLGYATDVKGYRLWNPITCKIIVSRDVAFNEPKTLKEGENAQAPTTNMDKSSLSDTIEGEIGHYISNDMPQGETPMQKEVIFEQQEIEEQAIDGESLTIAPDDQDQAKTSTRRSSSRTTNALERYGILANSSLLKDSDIIGEQKDEDGLILKEEEPSSYNETQTCKAKFE